MAAMAANAQGKHRQRGGNAFRTPRLCWRLGRVIDLADKALQQLARVGGHKVQPAGQRQGAGHSGNGQPG